MPGSFKALAAAAIVCLCGQARADAADVSGVVVAVEGDDLILDLGTTKGAISDQAVEIWRAVQVRHPVSGQMLSDRFLIGHLKLRQVRPAMSLAAPDGTLTRTAKVGDIVLLKPAPVTPPKVEAQAPVVVQQVADPDASELSALFNSLHGADPQERADRYTRYAQSHPQSRFSRTLLEEAKALLTRERAPVVEVAPPLVVSFSPPERTYAGVPLSISVELRPLCKGAVLYVATSDRTTFASFPMTAEGGNYFGATIPAKDVHGSLRLFVEAVDEAGKTRPTDEAHTVEAIERPGVSLDTPVLATFGLWSDFATYNTRSFNDWTFQTEGYFGARFRDIGLRAVRSGFGVYRGVGGSLHELDDLGLAGRDVGLTYGYLEVEAAFSHIVSLIGRGVIGLDQDGIEGGAQAFIRFGNDLGTNLLLGGEVLGGVGVRGIAQVEWNAGPRFPIMFRSEVTNQPAGSAHQEVSGISSSQGDVGVRLITQVGYRIRPSLTLALRASYQGRTINHAGPGGGAAVSYQW